MLAPALETMRANGVVFPKGWNARSRCRPSWEVQQEEMDAKLKELEERVATKMVTKTKNVKIPMDWKKLQEVFEIGCGDAEEQVWEQEIYEWRKKWEKFVRSPIDKYTGEIAVM